MKKNIAILSLLCFLLVHNCFLNAQAPPLVPSSWPTLKGLWTFDNPVNLLEAAYGNDLILYGNHTAVNGPNSSDGAVHIGTGSYYKCFHDIPSNGGGSMVNEYSLLIDFRIPATGSWYCFYQTDAANANDGELFVSPSGTVGRATNGPGYTSYVLNPGEWYRLAVTADLDSQYKIYLDGILVKLGGALAMDGDYALYPAGGNNFFYFFADDNGEDAPIDIALCAVFEDVLTPGQLEELGGYGHFIPPVLTGIRPYLQGMTPSSVYICWHSDSITGTQVDYGEHATLGFTVPGSYETIGTKKWHTVHLTGLQPGTRYFYRCSSGGEQSPVRFFRTPPPDNQTQGHVRALVFGDSQSDITQSTWIVAKAVEKMQEIFGDSLCNHIHHIMHVGDIVGNGNNLASYETEFFNPFSPLSAFLPLMPAIGNHEMDNAGYYQYMKNEAYTGALPPATERYYTYRMAAVRFIVINTNPAYQDMTQLMWISNILYEANNDSSIRFIAVYGHHPAQSELWPAGNTAWVSGQIMTLLKNSPKVVFYGCGHTHAYEHAVISSSDTSAGFHAVIGGGAGGALDRWGMFSNQTDYPQTMKSLDHYHFTLLEFDLENQVFHADVYSLGHPDLSLDCWHADSFYRNMLSMPPQAPQALSISGILQGPVILQASACQGNDSLMSAWYQLTGIPGNYSNPLINASTDKENVYLDTGPPAYQPIDLNQGLNLSEFTLPLSLDSGQTYGWRVRYRDHNLNWSAWSNEHVFTYKAGFGISGYVSYDNPSQSGLAGVQLWLIKDSILVSQVQTAADGSFSFPPQLPGHYTIEGVHNGVWGGVNATDALMVLQQYVGMISLTGIRLQAADADGNHAINAIDALMVARRFTGQLNTFPAPDWIVESPAFTLGAAAAGFTLKAVCRGDVNGSYQP
ncbi:MAG TPA: fibronectin type III domain-containing protein [Bacteroidales bacterium]|nr:fibronectin type III domain-containing protein [Bacteroidales bacterium]HSA44855.1 fibronectin type III domain-containing protein [Bacteroidales bacterium]